MANANPTLPDLLRSRIRATQEGRLPWAEVMRMALYEPGLGYYRRGVRAIGRGGDFYTSVSVGPLFGALLGEFAFQTWQRVGEPGSFSIIEQGAHDGTLARDILEAARKLPEGFRGALRYAILEPDEALRQAQRGKAGDLGPTLTHDLSTCEGPALFLCNELLDAFPVHRVLWDGQSWHELWVGEDADASCGFRFLEGELSDPRLAEQLQPHGADLPAGWTTEVCLSTASWLDEVSRLPFTGSVLILDYGFTATEHFAPERSEGTLRRYLGHRMDDQVLENPGEADLTAHVDFTQVAEQARERGFAVQEPTDQGRFLTQLFVDAFTRHGVPPDAATQRQFHTLTHPGHMGRSFRALILEKKR